MADPKYANLPGIAHDQPDVYETGDLPESEQHYDDEDAEQGGLGGIIDNAVETLHISASDAMGRFAGKNLDASGVDFSDRIKGGGGGWGKRGYVAWSGDLELVNRGGAEPETAVQRYNRLKCEAGELWEEVNGMKNEAAAGSDKKRSAAASDINSLAAKVSSLQDELGNMRLEETLGAALVKNLEDPHGSANAKLLAHLDQVKMARTAKKPAADSSGSSSGGEKGGVTYELLMKPDNAKLEGDERVARLDRRLEAIEKALGANPEAMSSLCLETNAKSIAGAASVLMSRTALLQPAHLDHVEGRLALLAQKMNDVAERKAALLDDADKQSRIDELYESVQKYDGMAAALPDIVDRLETLQGLHQQALEFSTALAQVDSVQQKLTANLSSSAGMLKQTQNMFDKNAEKVAQNLKEMDERLKKLGK